MSTDISGWVEVKVNDYWFGTVRVGPHIIGRNYRMFDFLFGGRSENYEQAIAGKRPLSEVSRDAGTPTSWESWISLAELLDVD